jgi:hypothetical protein
MFPPGQVLPVDFPHALDAATLHSDMYLLTGRRRLATDRLFFTSRILPHGSAELCRALHRCTAYRRTSQSALARQCERTWQQSSGPGSCGRVEIGSLSPVLKYRACDDAVVRLGSERYAKRHRCIIFSARKERSHRYYSSSFPVSRHRLAACAHSCCDRADRSQ